MANSRLVAKPDKFFFADSTSTSTSVTQELTHFCVAGWSSIRNEGGVKTAGVRRSRLPLEGLSNVSSFEVFLSNWPHSGRHRPDRQNPERHANRGGEPKRLHSFDPIDLFEYQHQHGYPTKS